MEYFFHWIAILNCTLNMCRYGHSALILLEKIVSSKYCAILYEQTETYIYL